MAANSGDCRWFGQGVLSLLWQRQVHWQAYRVGIGRFWIDDKWHGGWCARVDARVATAAMALITAATEPNHQVVAFSNPDGASQRISPRQRLDDVLKNTDNIPFGGTDCALPHDLGE